MPSVGSEEMDRVRKAHGAEGFGLTDGNRRRWLRNLSFNGRLELEIHDECPRKNTSEDLASVFGMKS